MHPQVARNRATSSTTQLSNGGGIEELQRNLEKRNKVNFEEFHD